jgi:CheY-like chemotaxis protein
MSHVLSDTRPAEVLLVEDNDDDVYLTQRAFKAAKFLVNLHHVNNGRKCMEFLRKQPPYVDAPTPDLILLDLNLPIMDGREVLAEIVKDEALRHLPVVVLTTSYEAEDVQKMYKLRCSSYITKPVDFEKFAEAVRKLEDYWLTVVVLPTKKDQPASGSI